MRNEGGCNIPAVKERDIPRAMEKLGKALNILHDKVNILGERISPILRNEPHGAKESPGKAAWSTQLAEDVQVDIDRVENITEIVDSLIERCQL